MLILNPGSLSSEDFLIWACLIEKGSSYLQLSSINIFQTPTLNTRVSASLYQSMTINACSCFQPFIDQMGLLGQWGWGKGFFVFFFSGYNRTRFLWIMLHPHGSHLKAFYVYLVTPVHWRLYSHHP